MPFECVRLKTKIVPGDLSTKLSCFKIPNCYSRNIKTNAAVGFHMFHKKKSGTTKFSAYLIQS